MNDLARNWPPGVSTRGNPDVLGRLEFPADTIVHLRLPRSWDGCYEEQTLCTYGGHHICWSRSMIDVTCPDCRKLATLAPRFNVVFPDTVLTRDDLHQLELVRMQLARSK